MSLINKEISDFKVDAFQKKEGSAQGEFKQYTKADLKGKWSVFFFYPADFTFVCPTELADLQDQYAEFQKLGCEIFGVSCDSHFVHKAWHESSDLVGRLTYPMLADPTAKLARDFDVYIEEDGRSEPRGQDRFLRGKRGQCWPQRCRAPPQSAGTPVRR